MIAPLVTSWTRARATSMMAPVDMVSLAPLRTCSYRIRAILTLCSSRYHKQRPRLPPSVPPTSIRRQAVITATMVKRKRKRASRLSLKRKKTMAKMMIVRKAHSLTTTHPSKFSTTTKQERPTRRKFSNNNSRTTSHANTSHTPPHKTFNSRLPSKLAAIIGMDPPTLATARCPRSSHPLLPSH